MYEFGSGGEYDMMNLDSNMYNFIQEEFQTKDMLDILDLDKLNTENEINGNENQSNRADSEDFSVCSQLNEYSPSRTVLEDYNFRFLHPKGDMIDPPWKRVNNFTHSDNIKIPEFIENCSYSASPLIYSDVIQNEDATLSNGNNMPQEYNLSHHEPSRADSAPASLINTRKVLNILETNDTSRKIVIDPANNSYNGPCNSNQQAARTIENIHALQGKQRSFIENEQENSAKKSVVRIVLQRRKDILSINQNSETIERYQVVLPAVRRNRDSLHTFKPQKEDTKKERIMPVSEDNIGRLQKVDVISSTKKFNFICQICGEKFVTRCSLITHMKSHRQPFCSSCITLYKSREQLRQHINRLHVAPPPPEVTVVTSKYGRKRQVFCPLSLMTRRKSINKRLTF